MVVPLTPAVASTTLPFLSTIISTTIVPCSCEVYSGLGIPPIGLLPSRLKDVPLPLPPKPLRLSLSGFPNSEPPVPDCPEVPELPELLLFDLEPLYKAFGFTTGSGLPTSGASCFSFSFLSLSSSFSSAIYGSSSDWEVISLLSSFETSSSGWAGAGFTK